MLEFLRPSKQSFDENFHPTESFQVCFFNFDFVLKI